MSDIALQVPKESPAASKAFWRKVAVSLIASTLVYNVLEAVLALWSGALAESVALIGFGLDSIIETIAAIVVLWRLIVESQGASPERIERIEHKTYRFVGFTFMILIAYVIGQSAYTLFTKSAPEESTLGMILAAVSLVLMPIVAWGKLRAAREIGSAALRAEAKETLACSYLSFTLLLGLVLHSLFGWWWADPIAALLMVPWLFKEGLEGLRGEHHGH